MTTDSNFVRPLSLTDFAASRLAESQGRKRSLLYVAGQADWLEGHWRVAAAAAAPVAASRGGGGGGPFFN